MFLSDLPCTLDFPARAGDPSCRGQFIFEGADVLVLPGFRFLVGVGPRDVYVHSFLYLLVEFGFNGEGDGRG